MIRGLYTSALGMVGQMKRMDVVANNMANASTTGFQRDVVISQSFSDVMMERVRDYEMRGLNTANIAGPASLGIITATVYTDNTTGAIQQSGNPLDVALVGTGFFEVLVSGDAEEPLTRFTRSGSLTLNQYGVLTDLMGNPILSVEGAPITIPTGIIAINETGAITSNGEYIDTIRLLDFEDHTTLRAFGNSLFDITEDSVEVPFEGRLVQSYLEMSNVNIVREMVEMIALSRAYEANSRMIAIADQTLGQAVNEIARR